MATRSSGVMARFVGGPNTEFISGRLATIRGASRVLMSTTETTSLPGGRNTTLPVSSHVTFWSTPTIMYCGPGTIDAVVAHADRARPANNVSPRLHQPAARTLRCVVIGISLGTRLGPHRGTVGGGNAIAQREGRRDLPPASRTGGAELQTRGHGIALGVAGGFRVPHLHARRGRPRALLQRARGRLGPALAEGRHLGVGQRRRLDQLPEQRLVEGSIGAATAHQRQHGVGALALLP